MIITVLQGIKNKDIGNAFRMAVVGSTMLGPFNYKWYGILDKMVQGSGAKVVIKKMCCDQLIAGPIGIIIFYIGTFSHQLYICLSLTGA